VSSPSSRWIRPARALHDHQAVDEEAVALRRRDAAGRRVRARRCSPFLEVGHHVADRGRRQLEPRLLRQHTRSHRLTVDDETARRGSSAGTVSGGRAWDPFYRRRRPIGCRSSRSCGCPLGRKGRRSSLVGFGEESGLCSNRGDDFAYDRRPPLRRRRVPPGALIGRHASADLAQPLSRLAAFLRLRRTRRRDRGGNRALDAAFRLPVGTARITRRARRRRDRGRRRRHDARDRAPARAAQRSADRDQSGTIGAF